MERRFHLLGIEQTEQTAESVMAGCAIDRRIDDINQLRPVACDEVSDADATACAAQRRRQRGEQQSRELIPSRVVARVVDRPGSRGRYQSMPRYAQMHLVAGVRDAPAETRPCRKGSREGVAWL